MKDEIIIYQADELSARLEVRIEDETLWMTQYQNVSLFESSKANISEHIKNIYKSNELDEQATVRFFRTLQNEGGRNVTRERMYYSLDVIISVGYRVNSIRGTQFRIWANKFRRAHDRFMILDEKTVYHIGASLKDLGRKWFAFSKMEIESKLLLNKLIKAA